MVLREFKDDVCTFEEFEEVIWNCTKSYLACFIILALKYGAPYVYINLAYNVFECRFALKNKERKKEKELESEIYE